MALMGLACTLAAFAQQGAGSGAETTLSSNAELVQVPVQVKDSSGKPVHGLLQSDFVLRSDGKVQTVKVFEELDGTQDSAADEKPQPDKDDGNPQYSSVPEKGLPEQLLVIVLDQLNTPVAEQGQARQQLMKYFANAKLSVGQSFALMTITKDGLRSVLPFTSDPKVLLAAVKGETAKLGKTEQTQETLYAPLAPLSHLSNNDIGIYQEAGEANAANVTVQSFAQLQQAYSGIPGRKSVLWLSANPPQVNAVSNMLDQSNIAIANLVNRSNIAIYPVDLKGAHSDSQYLAEDSNLPNTTDDRGNQGVVTDTSVFFGPQYQDDSRRGLATRTGGRFCGSVAALQSCIDQAIDDSASYYTLGFYVSQQDRVVGWHKLDVKLASGKEKVHARSGYYLEAKTPPTDKDLRNGMLTAVNAKIGYTGVAFTVERLPAAPPATAVAEPATPAAGTFPSTAPATAPPPASLSFRIRVPASSVMLESGEQKLSYEIAMVPLSDKGEPLTDIKTTRLDLDAQKTQEALAKGWRYDETLPQDSSPSVVKFVVRDNAAGRIGTVTVPVNR